jgi:hypothetical protein
MSPIEDDECTFESLDEMEQYRGKKLGHLKFIGIQPDSIFEINNPINGRVTLTTSNIDDWFASFDKITDLLTKRSRFKDAPLFPFALVIFTILLALILSLIYLQRIPLFGGILLVIFVYLIPFILGASVHYGKFNKVTLNRRHEIPHFWSSNMNTIITGIIGSIIGAGLTLLVVYLTYRFGFK